MDDDLYYRSERGGGRDGLFAWTIAILLLVGVAFACWILSFYVFGNPEQPFSYSMLKKLGKLDPPKRFELTTAPRGEFLSAQQLYERFSGLPEFELKNQNDTLFRGYLRNYNDRSFKVPYVMGAFNILDSYALESDDRFPAGAVVLAQSKEFPAVLIEHIFTTEPANVPALQRMMVTGLDMRLRRTYDLSAVVRVTKMEDGRLLLTMVPLLYGSDPLGEGMATLRLEPPQELNMEAPWPITSSERLQEADVKYALYRKNAGLPPASIAAVPAPTPSSLPGATPQATPAAAAPVAATTPLPGATPVPVATPLPVATPFGTPAATPAVAASTSVPVATPLPASSPVAAPTAIPAPTPGSAVAAATPASGDVPLKPFLSSGPTSGTSPAAAPGGGWTLYKPGAMPSGRLISPRETTPLADQGTRGERIYLEGQFAVTASDNNRAILRPRDGSMFGQGNRVRVIADFPAGSAPREGAEVTRGELRPFEIREVRRGADGEINVYVREITQP